MNKIVIKGIVFVIIRMSIKTDSIPWVEKYRPTHFDQIVLDPLNRKLFNNILTNKYFPNLLFYGPPGTGKTTTIINLINEYQKQCNMTNKGAVIHLNASDERGIDIIRNQIYQFVKSKNFFEAGMKFVILDEVDYMTKTAQHALKILLKTSCYNVRFCLICNYISKIDESLKNDFICIRFNQLPTKDIHNFVKIIAEKENLDLSESIINTIQQNYQSDIRSMINFIQLNQNNIDWESKIITNAIWDNITQMIICETTNVIQYIHKISIQYNMDKKNIIKNYFNYIIRNKPEYITEELLSVIEVIMHSSDTNVEVIMHYFVQKMNSIFIRAQMKQTK
jgi:DNA polymerase III delta prime subunit